MSTVRFEIPFRLPGLNEIICADRTHWAKGAKLKGKSQREVLLVLKGLKLQGVSKPVAVTYVWHDTSRRDPGNIAGGGDKIIMDALQDAGILPNDNKKWIKAISHLFMDDGPDRVVVTLREV